MNEIELVNVDLTDFTKAAFNPLCIAMEDGDERDENFYTTDNKFGWNVSSAEIICSKSDKKILEYRLFSINGIEQAHAKLIETKELVYWRYEFLCRELPYSPDMFEPSLSDFLDFYYTELINRKDLLTAAMELPMVYYEISVLSKLKQIRYAHAVNNILTKPLFYISVDKSGFLQSISDLQGTDVKHCIYPTQDYPNNYLLQKFSNLDSNNLHKLEGTTKNENGTIIFEGFKNHEVHYLTNPLLESEFVKYGFFVKELRSIINEAEILLKFIPTVNYHLIKPCNMVCDHCFSDFDELEKGQLEFNEAVQIIEEISSIKSFRKLNFSGGEPTLFNGIEELIKKAKSKGLETSMVTNGFKLIRSLELFSSLIGSLDLLVLSIDSFDNDLNTQIGRHVRNKTITENELISLAEKCNENGIKIKINTVVTKKNFNQIMAPKICKLYPIRWKIFRMLPVANQNEKANDIYPSDDEFRKFLSLNKPFAEDNKIKVVSEDNLEMTGSYLMISPDGRFFNNIEGVHNYSDPILKAGIRNALAQTPLLREVFYKREGDYSCN
jgi:radical S-adenosyl methionine domain-containing protein 2